MAEPLPRAIPSPRAISPFRDSLVERVKWSLYSFLAIFALPFDLRESDGYPLEEFLPVIITRDESSSQSYNNPIPPFPITGENCTDSYGIPRFNPPPSYYVYCYIQGKPFKNENICWPIIPTQLGGVKRVLYEEELSVKQETQLAGEAQSSLGVESVMTDSLPETSSLRPSIRPFWY